MSASVSLKDTGMHSRSVQLQNKGESNESSINKKDRRRAVQHTI